MGRPWCAATPDKAICAVADLVLGDNSWMESLDDEAVGAVSGSGSGWCSGNGAREARTRSGAAEAEEAGQALVEGAIMAAGN